MAERYFRARSTTFACGGCGRRTRDTTGTNQGLCPQCDERTMIENSLVNDALTAIEVRDAEARIATLKALAIKKCGRFEESPAEGARGNMGA